MGERGCEEITKANVLISNVRIGTYLCHVQFLKRVRQPVYGAGSGLYTISKAVIAAPTKASCVSVAAYMRQLIIITFGDCLYVQTTSKSRRILTMLSDIRNRSMYLLQSHRA